VAQDRQNVRLHTFAVLAGINLVLASLGASGVNIYSIAPRFAAVLNFIQVWSGADNRFGFFAPSVGGERRPLIHYQLPSGDWQTATIVSTRSEGMQRLGTFNHYLQERNLQESVCASIAAWFFGQKPEAKYLIIEVQVYAIPSRTEFKQHQATPHWRTLQIYNFAHVARG
jgi:hypothetical protein